MIVSMVVTDDKTVVHSNESCGEHSGNIRPPCFFPVPFRIAEGRHGEQSMLLTYHMMVCVFIELDDSMGQERMNLFHSATIEYSLDE